MHLYPKFTSVTTLSKILALILFIALPFIGFYVGSNYKETIKTLYESCTPQASTSTKDENGLITFSGTLTMEKIPAEEQLGDYRFIINFDQPFLLEENAAGFPMYVNSMMVLEPTSGDIELYDYVDEHVQIKGTLTWGYAESRVIQAVEIKILP